MGLTIRSAAGSRPVEPRASRWPAVEDERGIGVLDETGERILYTESELRAWRLSRLLRVLDPTPEQLERLLDDPRLLRSLELRFGSVCWICGRPLKAGQRARWNTETKLARHLRRCPPVKRRGKAA